MSSIIATIYEHEVWLGRWLSPDTSFDPKWTDVSGSRVPAPDELSSWTSQPWEYATLPSDFHKPGRAVVHDARAGHLVRRRPWTSSSVAGARSRASSAATRPSASAVAGADVSVSGVWEADADARSCCVCAKAFSLTFRRHHCRECGRVVCGACSAHKKLLVFSAVSAAEASRVCDSCARAPSGARAQPGAAGGLVRPHSRSALLATIGAGAVDAAVGSGGAAARAFLRALSTELGSHAVSGGVAEGGAVEDEEKSDEEGGARNTVGACAVAHLGRAGGSNRTSAFAGVAALAFARGSWDARAASLVRSAAATAGVPWSAVTLDFHMALSLGPLDARMTASAARSPATLKASSSRDNPGTSSASVKASGRARVAGVLLAAAAGTAVLATGGAAIGVAAAVAASKVGVVCFGAAKGVALVGGTVAGGGLGGLLGGSQVRQAARGLSEIEFECLSHEALMSPRALRALAAVNASGRTHAAGTTPPNAHNADVPGIVIAICGLAAATPSQHSTPSGGGGVTREKTPPEQRVLADYATPWGGVENARARQRINSGAYGGGEAELAPGWWCASARPSAHGGELWLYAWGWTALSELETTVSAASAAAEHGVDKRTAGGAVGTALTALKLAADPWERALREADHAGLELAASILAGSQGASIGGRRPVTLIGYGLGARVAFVAARELGRLALKAADIAPDTEHHVGSSGGGGGGGGSDVGDHGGGDEATVMNTPLLTEADIRSGASTAGSHLIAHWPDATPAPSGIPRSGVAPHTILLDVILLGAPVEANDTESWGLVRRATAGRVVSAYSTSDVFLAAVEGTGIVKDAAGLRPVGGASGATPFIFETETGAAVASDAEGVESWDVSPLVPSHADWSSSIPRALDAVCYTGIDEAVLYETWDGEPRAIPRTERLAALVQLKGLYKLLNDLRNAATRDGSHGVASPAYAQVASLVCEIRDGCKALRARFPETAAAERVEDDAFAAARSLVNTALADFRAFGVTRRIIAQPFPTPPSSPPPLGDAEIEILKGAATLIAIADPIAACDLADTAAEAAIIPVPPAVASGSVHGGTGGGGSFGGWNPLRIAQVQIPPALLSFPARLLAAAGRAHAAHVRLGEIFAPPLYKFRHALTWSLLRGAQAAASAALYGFVPRENALGALGDALHAARRWEVEAAEEIGDEDDTAEAHLLRTALIDGHLSAVFSALFSPEAVVTPSTKDHRGDGRGSGGGSGLPHIW